MSRFWRRKAAPTEPEPGTLDYSLWFFNRTFPGPTRREELQALWRWLRTCESEYVTLLIGVTLCAALTAWIGITDHAMAIAVVPIAMFWSGMMGYAVAKLHD